MKKRTLRIYSRHPSHDPLRKSVLVDGLVLLRFGSTTSSKIKYDTELNPIESVKNSASKWLMKQCFTKAGVKTADWWIYSQDEANTFYNSKMEKEQGIDNYNTQRYDQLPYPLIAKHHYGSRGTGNYKINFKEELEKFVSSHDISKYIIESFKTFTREYRLHCTKDGCFYACRKVLKRDTPADKRFQRHNDNSSWLLETNAQFDRPVNWDAIVADCVKALQSLGGDIMAFDVKVQSATDKEGKKRENPDYIVIESCSAPSLASVGIQKYKEIIPQLVKQKLNIL